MKKHRFTSRRNFLKTGAAGIAGSAFLSACSRPAPQKQAKDRNLVCRTLGRTGLRLPVVSMGSTYAVDLVRAAHNEGIVYFHTSSSYSERNHERLLGEALRDLPRDAFVNASSPSLIGDVRGHWTSGQAPTPRSSHNRLREVCSVSASSMSISTTSVPSAAGKPRSTIRT